MSKIFKILSKILAFAAAAAPVSAADQPTEQTVRSHPRIALSELLTAVRDESGRRFLVDARVPAEVVAGDLQQRKISYGTLLGILRNNGMATVTIGGITNVVPVSHVRQYPLPVLYEDDQSRHDEEWVSRIVTLENAHAATLVPIMRPLLPQAGHMAANPDSHTIVLVDRNANVRRIAAMIARIDELTPPDID